jgi:hypothetical protein
MVSIMTINLVMRIRLIGVKVDGSGLMRIRAIFFHTRPTTSQTFILSPWFHII